jgi:beta-glucosidase
VVLLRNEPVAGAPALPLHPTELNRLAVIGPQADVVCVQGGGSASVTPHRQRTILQAITERFGSVEIVHERGTNAHRTLPPLDLRWLRNPRTGEPGVHVEYFEGRGFDTPLGEHEASTARFQWLGVPWPGVPTGNFSARITTEVVVNEDVMMEFGLVVGGSGRVALDGDTVLDMWDRFVPGEAFFGLGSAQISVEVQLRAGEPRQLTAEFACMEGVPMGAMILGGLPTLASDGIERAAAAAASSDAAVVVVGLNQDWETEGSDRASWDLPGDQVALIRAVAAAQPRTVVLVQAGSPVDLDWEQEAAAVAQVWYLGQEGPDALAELLSGDHSPSGHLPTTLPQRFLDHPAVENYPGSFGEVVYGESVFVGYRFYDHREIAPRHRFGFGLSYTEFELSDLEVSEDGDRLTLGVTIANVGGSRGSAVVQVYVAPPSSDIPRPPRELKGFAKCELGAAETARVHIELPPRAFQHWDPERSDWATVAGEYEIEVGQFAGDRALAARVSK